MSCPRCECGGPVARASAPSSVASRADRVAMVELGLQLPELCLQLVDLGLDLLLGLLAPLLAQPLAGGRRGRLLSILRGGDLRLDLLEWTAYDAASEPGHRGVDDLEALLGQLGDQGCAAGPHGPGDVAQRRL